MSDTTTRRQSRSLVGKPPRDDGKRSLGGLLAIVCLIAPVARADDTRFRFAAVVTDDAPRHVHEPGKRIAVDVLPVVAAGPSLTWNVANVALEPAAKPFAQDGINELGPRLLGEQPSHDGVTVDFWGVPEAQRRLNLVVWFKSPVLLTGLTLTGTNPNDQFGVSDASIELIGGDDRHERAVVATLREGEAWHIVFGRPKATWVKAAIVRVGVPYKVKLTQLVVQGRPRDAAPDAFTSREGAGVTFAAQWQTAAGEPIAQPVPLSPDAPTHVATPANVAAGYVGLCVIGSDGGVPVWRQTSGFAVLPPRPTTPSADSPFGLVHVDTGDANPGASWSKTMTCDNFIDAQHGSGNGDAFRAAIADRAKRGFTELPILINANWQSDPTKPVPDDQLARLRQQMTDLFRASPQTTAYELGLEENLHYRGEREKQTHFWSNLAAKAKVVREAANAVNPQIRLVYQIAEFDRDSVREFFASDASKYFQVLSLHPYAWAAFPMPDEWLAQYVDDCRAMMTSAGRPMAIWFTEIGAPHAGHPGDFFGYPSSNSYVTGLSADDYASYLVRGHVLALADGVEKVFWYNYRDASNDPAWAEQHFGMIDCRGFPKPGYVAYATMTRMLAGRSFASMRRDGQQTIVRFRGEDDDCLVIWGEGRLSIEGARSACDAYGATIDVVNRSASRSPVYVVVPHVAGGSTSSPTGRGN